MRSLTDRPTFRALGHRNARLFFAGLWVSQVGSWMQTVATALLVKRLAPPRWEGVLLGAAIAAQLAEGLRAGVPGLNEQIMQGDFSGLTGWLRERVQGHGARLPLPALIKQATGKPLAAAPLLRYLESRYLEGAR